MTTNDAAKLAVMQAQYTLLCHPSGGIVDDCIVVVSSVASVELPLETVAPPATNSVSSVEPAVLLEKPMPNSIRLFCDDQLVAVHARLLLMSTR